jgi:hypothetical protein
MNLGPGWDCLMKKSEAKNLEKHSRKVCSDLNMSKKELAGSGSPKAAHFSFLKALNQFLFFTR